MKWNLATGLFGLLAVFGLLLPLNAADNTDKTIKTDKTAKADKTIKTAKTAKADKKAAQPSAGQKLTVAVLDFTSADATNPNAGSELASALTAMLSGEAGITLVERQSLMQTLHEHELNLTGLVHDDQAIKVGKLAGAKIMVTGRSFPLGKDLLITAKIIGTETSLVESVVVKDAVPGDMGAMVVQLSEKVAATLRQSGPKLVAAPDDLMDPVPALKKKLADRRKPVVAVIVREQHHGATQAASRDVIDPAVETEIKKLLIECGFTVQDIPQNVLTDLRKEWTVIEHVSDWRTDFYRRWRVTDDSAWPRSMQKVEVLIAGEAFSEFAARIGNIVSCSARVEIDVAARDSGKILLADRATTRAADLSENIAGKKALQNGGRAMAIRILENFAETLPREEAKKK
jgi:hypothetical protein